MPFVWLRSLVADQADGKQKHVCAENGGGTWLYANRELARAWESFVLVRHTDHGDAWLHNGDEISLKAPSGQYVCADASLGDVPLVANRGNPDTWERFTVQCRDSTPQGAVIDNNLKPGGTLVTLFAHSNQKFVRVDHGGDKRLHALGDTPGWWEGFYLGFGGGEAERPSNAVWRAVEPVQ